MGARASLPDYLPAIGRSTRAVNLFYAFGHQRLGLTLGPITAEALAALVTGGRPALDLAPFDLDRFSRVCDRAPGRSNAAPPGQRRSAASATTHPTQG